MDCGGEDRNRCLASVVSYPGRVSAAWRLVSNTLDPQPTPPRSAARLPIPTRAQARDVRHRDPAVDRQVALAIPRSALLRLGDQTVVS